MKFKILVLLLAFSACNDQDSTQTQEVANSVSVYSDTLTRKLIEIEKESIIPGFAVAIVHDDQVVYEQGFGYSNLKDSVLFTPRSVNFIASISKTFTGVGIMKLVEMGKLDLNEEVNNILPYKIINPHFPEIPITVKHLVTHTAGVKDAYDLEAIGDAEIVLLEEMEYEDKRIDSIMEQDFSYYRLGKYITLQESVERYLSEDGKWYSEDNFSDYPPGTKYAYSNLGADLAASIIELKSGMGFADFTQEYIFEPLEMSNTAWFYEDIDKALLSSIYRPDDWDTPTVAIEHPKYYYVGYSAGDLKSNIEDLCKYLMDMLNGFHGSGKILSAQSYKTLFEPGLDASYFDEDRDESPLNDEYNVGVFWAVSADGIRLHNGGSIGVYSFLYFNPITNSGAVGFSNLPDASFGKIRDAVYEYETKISQ